MACAASEVTVERWAAARTAMAMATAALAAVVPAAATVTAALAAAVAVTAAVTARWVVVVGKRGAHRWSIHSDECNYSC